MKNLLLVGATGYLGQHIKKYYEGIGWLVTTLGRSPGNDIRVDIGSDTHVSSVILNKKYDRLIHAAAINEVDIGKDLTKSYTINVISTRLLLKLAKNNHINEFVYISTFHVYGQAYGRIDEHHITMPVNDYGLTHLLSEEIVIKFAKANKLTPLIVRPTNIFGLPVDIRSFNRWSLVPFSFVYSGVTEGQITLNTSGQQMRNFVDVIDVVKTTELSGRCLVVNAAGEKNLTVRQFAFEVASVLKDQYNIICKVNWSKADLSRYEELSVCNRGVELNPQGDLTQFISDFARAQLNYAK